MTPFERAYSPLGEADNLAAAFIAQLLDPANKAEADATMGGRKDWTKEELRRQIYKIVAEECKHPVYRNDTYQVSVRRLPAIEGRPDMIHLSIKRNDRQPIHDWRELQKIKNAIVGPEHEGVELYPRESRLVDTANQYHLFVLAEEGATFPFGYRERSVTDKSFGKSVNRPLKP